MPELEIELTDEQMELLEKYAGIRRMECNDVFGSTVVPVFVAAAEQDRKPEEPAQ